MREKDLLVNDFRHFERLTFRVDLPQQCNRLLELLHFACETLVLADVEVHAFLPCGVGGGIVGVVEREVQLADGNVGAGLGLEG